MKKNILLPFLFIIQIISVKLLVFNNLFIEKYYSNGLYLILSKISRTIFGWIPFSIGDVFYCIIILLIINWFRIKRKGFLKKWKENSLTIVSFISVVYFLFHLLWGFNYYRVPIHKKLAIEKEYSIKELKLFTQKLIDKTNAIHLKITNNAQSKVVFKDNHDIIYRKAIEGYQQLPINLKFIKYTCPSIKSSLLSKPLSYMGFGGYLNPFTNEAQINNCKPMYTTPFTTCHEIAHQTGLASESECNFIGFISAYSNSDLHFQYSAYTGALMYCLTSLERHQAKSSLVYKNQLNPGILLNFDENKTFWQQYQTPLNDFFKYFYDNFLKLNQQKDGMEGYSKFVGLLINYDKKYLLIK